MSLFPQGRSIRELARGHLDTVPANMTETQPQVTDTDVVTLRIAVARIAQALGVQTDHLPVLDIGYQQLHDLATGENWGWNTLADTCVEKTAYFVELANHGT